MIWNLHKSSGRLIPRSTLGDTSTNGLSERLNASITASLSLTAWVVSLFSPNDITASLRRYDVVWITPLSDLCRLRIIFTCFNSPSISWVLYAMSTAESRSNTMRRFSIGNVQGSSMTSASDSGMPNIRQYVPISGNVEESRTIFLPCLNKKRSDNIGVSHVGL